MHRQSVVVRDIVRAQEVCQRAEDMGIKPCCHGGAGADHGGTRSAGLAAGPGHGCASRSPRVACCARSWGGADEEFLEVLGWTTLVLAVVGAYAGYRIVWGHPFTINQLANRQLLFYMMATRTLTSVGIVDGTILDRHSGKLAEVEDGPIHDSDRGEELRVVHHVEQQLPVRKLVDGKRVSPDDAVAGVRADHREDVP